MQELCFSLSWPDRPTTTQARLAHRPVVPHSLLLKGENVHSSLQANRPSPPCQRTVNALFLLNFTFVAYNCTSFRNCSKFWNLLQEMCCTDAYLDWTSHAWHAVTVARSEVWFKHWAWPQSKSCNLCNFTNLKVIFWFLKGNYVPVVTTAASWCGGAVNQCWLAAPERYAHTLFCL